MKLKVYSVYDEKAKAFNQPFYQNNAGQASRSFGDSVSKPESTVAKHAADFRLYEIGDFDDETGKIVSYEMPIFITSATDFVRPISQENIERVEE